MSNNNYLSWLSTRRTYFLRFLLIRPIPSRSGEWLLYRLIVHIVDHGLPSS